MKTRQNNIVNTVPKLLRHQKTLVETSRHNDYRDSDLDLGQQTLVDTSRHQQTLVVTWTAFAILAMFQFFPILLDEIFTCTVTERFKPNSTMLPVPWIHVMKTGIILLYGCVLKYFLFSENTDALDLLDYPELAVLLVSLVLYLPQKYFIIEFCAISLTKQGYLCHRNIS